MDCFLGCKNRIDNNIEQFLINTCMNQISAILSHLIHEHIIA